MRSLPAGQAVYVYFDAERLRESGAFGDAFERAVGDRNSHQLVAKQLRAGAAAVGTDAVYVVLAAAAPESLLRAYLEDLGAACERPLSEAACVVLPEGASYPLAVRLLRGGVIAVTNSPDTSAADALTASGDGAAELAAPARDAIAAGALAWVEIDPPRLAAVMEDPPEGWVNLSLIARALINAETARITLSETGQGALEIRLRADTDEPEELSKMLEGLSRFGAAALRKSSSADASLWAEALEGFTAAPNENGVEGRWSLDAALLKNLLAD